MNPSEYESWRLWMGRSSYWFEKAKSQPSWVWRVAITLGVIVFVLPLVALALAAIVVGVAVLLALGVVVAIGQFFNRLVYGRKRGANHSVRGASWHEPSWSSADASDPSRVNVRVIE